MALMEPNYFVGTLILVDAASSLGEYVDTFYVPPEEVGEAVQNYMSFNRDKSCTIELTAETGVFCRLSAGGYLDQTPWSGPHVDLQVAERALLDEYDVCPQCGESLDEIGFPEDAETCPACGRLFISPKPFISSKKEV